MSMTVSERSLEGDTHFRRREAFRSGMEEAEELLSAKGRLQFGERPAVSPTLGSDIPDVLWSPLIPRPFSSRAWHPPPVPSKSRGLLLRALEVPQVFSGPLRVFIYLSDS